MDLQSIEDLHPSHDPERRLLILDLHHGKANEMGSEQLDALTRLCALLEEDASVSCLCTTSHRVSKKGTPIFIAGANVTERSGWEDERIKAHVLRQRALMRRLRRLPLFTVVLSHGVTLGWGVEYLLTADFSLATPDASFGLPETGLGIVPGARGTAELAQLVGPAQALRLGCTGEKVSAEEAVRIGLVQERVDDLDAGQARVRALAEQLRQRSPSAVAAFKRALLDGLGQPEAVRLDHERAAYEHTVDTGQAAIGRASFAAIREGRIPDWGSRR